MRSRRRLDVCSQLVLSCLSASTTLFVLLQDTDLDLHAQCSPFHKYDLRPSSAMLICFSSDKRGPTGETKGPV